MVQLLYFDGCPNWVEAESRVRDALNAVGRSDVRVERVLVSTDEEAQRLHFVGSPTVLVDGRDPFAEADAAVGLACRVYRSKTGLSGAPSVAELVEALTNA